MEDRMRTGELEPEKMYGFANGEPDMTGVPAALADRVRKKPGRKPKAEIAAAEAEKATGHEKETARDIDKAMEKPLMTAKTLEEMRGKRAREEAERKAMAEEIERLKAQLAEQQKETDALQMLYTEASEEIGNLRKRLAVSGRRVKLSEVKWKIWKDGVLVADG